MSDKPLPFVINDRRKFNSDGELRPEAERAPEPTPAPEHSAPESTKSPIPISEHDPHPAPHLVTDEPASPDAGPDSDEPNMPPPPSAEQMEQARLAFEATAERLDIAIRSANPGMDHPPAMSFEQLVQSIYMQSILQLGGGAQEGQQPQVDILGAKQSIDMLAVLSAKTTGNLSDSEQRLLDSALFELRLAFLEITQALARSAQARATQSTGAGPSPTPGRPGPSLIR